MASLPLPGSERVALSEMRSLRAADAHERLEVSVFLRSRAPEQLQARMAALHAAGSRRAVRALSRAAFAQRHGASSADMRAVRGFATRHGLTVVAASAARRTLMLSGNVAQFNAAFQVELQYFEHAHGSFRGRRGAIYLPEELQGIVTAVLGLDNRPQARTQFRILRPAAAGAQSFTPPQVAALYGFPNLTGAGQCIGLIELGGGFRPADLQSYFTSLGVTLPTVVAVSVDHATNTPGSADGPDGEVMLDIEVAGSVAPGAHIAVYFAPNTDAGFLDAITTAIHDDTHRPTILSISWGGPESSWTQQAMLAMDQALQAAAAMGITVCIAAGDNGSSDSVSGGGSHVDFPASSPHALACGGTTLKAAADNAIASEVVWNDGVRGGATGGGVSQVFALPAWQAGLRADRQGQPRALSMRGLPDVAANADPQTGYRVRVDGVDLTIGGTSAVAPLWAALMARLNESARRPLGLINALLYAKPAALRDITRGDNGSYQATFGWDACSGLGSPNGAKLVRL